MSPFDSFLGLSLSSILALAAMAQGSLSESGALGAVLVGTLTLAGGGWGWGLLLVAFFISSSALSHFHAQSKVPLAEKFQKGHRRDLGQVLANGGWGALLALASSLFTSPVWLIAFCGSVATVTADTWATELGVLCRTLPRSIVTGKTVPTGTSGGVTPLGTLVALGGGIFIGLLEFALGMLDRWTPVSLFPALRAAVPPNWLVLVTITVLSGWIGSLFDSFLGATVQATYYCDFDMKETESAFHRCGRATRLIRGWRWLDNDWVNFISSAFGSALAVGLYAILA